MKKHYNYLKNLKRFVLIFLFLTGVQMGFAQNSFPSTADVKLDGYSLRFELPVTTGGWARGGHFYNASGSTKLGGVGMYGVSTAPERIYLAHGSSPHSSTLGIQVLGSGNVGIGTINPLGKLQVQGDAGEQQQGQIHIVGNGESGPGDAYISFDEGGEPNSKWSLGARDNGNQFTISHGLTMDAKPMFTITDVAGSSGGNLGIGNPNPQTTLDVRGGAITLGYIGSGVPFKFWAGSSGADNQLRIGTDYGHSGDAALELYQNYGGGNEQNPGRVVVNGDLGVGTKSPQGKIHVKGDPGEQTYGQIHVQGNGEQGPGDAYISFHEGSESDSKWSLGVKDNQNVFSISKGLTMDADPKFMIFEDTGNVAIGTSYTGNHKLAVGGTIGAREIKVESGTWSDFVFYKDYPLPSLKEVEKHISEKGHLQNIPSEKEVKENGISLGAMDAKLLQKIEELMLYTIQQQKEIENLKKELQELKD